MAYENVYKTCPFCGKNYKLRIPKGGDGSALQFPKHYQSVFRVVVYGQKKITCPGSHRLVEDW